MPITFLDLFNYTRKLGAGRHPIKATMGAILEVEPDGTVYINESRFTTDVDGRRYIKIQFEPTPVPNEAVVYLGKYNRDGFGWKYDGISMYGKRYHIRTIIFGKGRVNWDEGSLEYHKDVAEGLIDALEPLSKNRLKREKIARSPLYGIRKIDWKKADLGMILIRSQLNVYIDGMRRQYEAMRLLVGEVLLMQHMLYSDSKILYDMMEIGYRHGLELAEHADLMAKALGAKPLEGYTFADYWKDNTILDFGESAPLKLDRTSWMDRRHDKKLIRVLGLDGRERKIY